MVRKTTLLVPNFAAAVNVAFSLRLKYLGPADSSKHSDDAVLQKNVLHYEPVNLKQRSQVVH
jgi:hypothetical protein